MHCFPTHALPITLAIVGGRGFNNYDLFKEIMVSVRKMFNVETVVTGDANGVDAYARRYAKEEGIELVVHEAQWTVDGEFDRAAGFKRNQLIWNDADAGIAIWDGRSPGTKHSIQLAPKADKVIVVFGYHIDESGKAVTDERF